MSIGRRLIDLARANLNALLEKAAPETSVDELTDEELQAELERRRARRLREDEERKSRESAERAARERAAQRQAAQKQAAQSTPGAGTRNSPPGAGTPRNSPPPRRPQATSARRPPPRPAPPGTERHLRDLYAQLEVPYGSDFETVKHSFRRLMRKYHPDLHVGNPAKQKTATELTMSLTQAYNELEEHLRRR